MVLTLLPMTALAAGMTERKSSSTIAVTIDLNTTYYDSQAEGWNAAVTAGAATVKLLADWKAAEGSFGTGAGFGDGTEGGTGAILVPASKTITLDLNRFNINRALDAAQANGNAITVNGVLTLMDSVGSYDKETYTYTAGGVYGGFNSGSGGGVIVNETGTLNMEGGRIGYPLKADKTGLESNRVAEGAKGAGVYMNGTMNFTHGYIHNNTANGTANNLYLPASKTLNLTAGVASDAVDVGVSTESSELGIVIATYAGTDASASNAALSFFSDDNWRGTALNKTTKTISLRSFTRR